MRTRVFSWVTGASVSAAVLAATAFGAEPAPRAAAQECLTVEFMMYSGRPRPQYVICEAGQQAEALHQLRAATAAPPQAGPAPALPSTPAYQGLLLLLPPTATERARSVLIRQGHIEGVAPGHVFLDQGRQLERYFLQLAADQPDRSLPGQSPPLQALVQRLLQDLDRAGQ